MRSRPDRQPDVGERRAKIEAAREEYVATPPFSLIADEDPNTHEDSSISSPPHLRAKPSPRPASVTKYWFNPSWIAEDEDPDVEHGEFQSPVWLAASMTMRADRDREAYEPGDLSHARHAAADSETGQLRTMLAFVSGAKHVDESPTSITSVTCINRSMADLKLDARSRYHGLAPRPVRQVPKFVRFISSSLGKVSVNHN